jgi:hypothetical protein
VSRVLFWKNAQIEQAFADLDSMAEREAVMIDHADAAKVEVFDMEDRRKQGRAP